MRVALLHNAASGSEDHTDEELTEEIRRAGHEVTHVSSTATDLLSAVKHGSCDLVVIAGGDGTVSRAACQLAGLRIPLSILPLGTANNTAVSLMMPAEALALARGWHSATRVPFDLAVLDDGEQQQRFAEATGWGVFPSSIVEAKRQSNAGDVGRTLLRNRQLFHAHAQQVQPRAYEIEVDGKDHSGDYLLVEVVNVPLIGPRLPLSPDSDPSDGFLEVVVAGERERGELERLATTPDEAPSALGVFRGSSIRITTDAALLHIDGQLLRHAAGQRTFQISVVPRAVDYLRPQTQSD